MSAWPPAGGNWEGGTVVDGRRLYHEPHAGWRDDGPARPAGPYQRPPRPDRIGRVYRDPRTRRRRSRAARWLHRHRHGILGWAVVAVVAGYATTIVLVFDRTLPTIRTAGILVAVAIALVALLLAAVLWACRDDR